MKVTSKDLYRILRERLAPGMKGAGFQRSKGGMLGWQRPVGARWLTLWFQCDKYGWFQDIGSSFTLEFQLSDDPQSCAGRLAERERFVALLSAEDRELARQCNDAILRNLPPLAADNPLSLLGAEGLQLIMLGWQPSAGPWAANQDVWLHYCNPQQVQDWAEFFAPRLLALSEEFLRRQG